MGCEAIPILAGILFYYAGIDWCRAAALIGMRRPSRIESDLLVNSEALQAMNQAGFTWEALKILGNILELSVPGHKRKHSLDIRNTQISIELYQDRMMRNIEKVYHD